ncbi:MAG: two-component regulator propeller domain-containing protein, partial [Anaerolineae bacterium]|nr:two-component regulator propeller domain-containing protein [Anaerolineae bacterium]
MRRARCLRLGLALLFLALLALPSLGAGPESPSWTQFRTLDGLPSDTVWAIAANSNRGDVWLGTSRGACLYRDGRWYTYTQAHGLGADWVAAVTVDADERVWFGTFGGGVTLFDGTDWHTYTAANSGLGSDWISALATDAQGRLWCGTWGRGVSVLDEGRWRTYLSGNSPLPTDYVTALAASPDGSIYVGLHGQGVARIAAGAWTLYDARRGLADDFVNALAAGPDGDLWVGTARGLNHLDAQGQVLQTYTAAEGLPADRVLALALDSAGRLWVGTSQGVAVLADGRWTVHRGQATLAHDYVSAIAAARDGVWFGSLSAGVARYGTGTVASARRLPVVLVHGWHGPESDRLEDSEFRFLASWLREDGYPVYYAGGISPENTLHQNAAQLRAAIERARAESGATRVDVIAFSMGGLNARSYVESSLYAGDVDQVFILGTPQAGVR